jgi:oligoribonuclease NrnB/cAMP/cGMP phosphodiesterase (DHH superfamily)
MRALVVFHENCTDGFGAAFAAWKALSGKGYEVDFYGARHGSPFDRDLTGFDQVTMVDFGYPHHDADPECGIEERLWMRPFVEFSGEFVWIDHHVSAMAAMDRVLSERETEVSIQGVHRVSKRTTITFDVTKSGALLTYEHFFEGEAPLLFQYISDRDLWTFRLPFTREVSSYLRTVPKTVEEYDALVAELQNQKSFDRIVFAGSAVLRSDIAEAEHAVKRAYRVRFPTSRPSTLSRFGTGVTPDDSWPVVPVVNTTSLISEIVGALAETAPFAVGWYRHHDEVRVSLRSRGADGSDVRAIAESFGGGGHRNAAGFTLRRDQFVTYLTQILEAKS